MTKRNKVQQQATKAILDSSFNGYIDVSPRVGKSKIIIDSLKQSSFTSKTKILITAPYNSILDSWKKEFDKWGLELKVDVVNQRSLSKIDLSAYEVVICDENT